MATWKITYLTGSVAILQADTVERDDDGQYIARRTGETVPVGLIPANNVLSIIRDETREA